MGSAQSSPIICEIVTAAEFFGKNIAGVACIIVGQSDAAINPGNGAIKSLENYANVNPLITVPRVLGNLAVGDTQKAGELVESTVEAWAEVAEGTPVVGHNKGAVHYAQGDPTAGDRCMINAMRATVVVAANACTGVLGGPAGAVAMAYSRDYSRDKGLFSLTGSVSAVAHAVKTGNANDIFDVSSTCDTDIAPGAVLERYPEAARVTVEINCEPAQADTDRERVRHIPSAEQLALNGW